tara:strand:+ start:456 stop:689 length:234 start_codon:yes stop_codon:yes gene_type:complete
MTQQDKPSERVVFLRKRIAFLQADLDGISTGVRSSGAGQYEREHLGRMIDRHLEEIQKLIEQMGDECALEYIKQHGV